MSLSGVSYKTGYPISGVSYITGCPLSGVSYKTGCTLPVVRLVIQLVAIYPWLVI